MSILNLDERNYNTPELKEIKKEAELLEEKYKVTHVITEDDIRSRLQYMDCQPGQIESRNPENPPDIDGFNELFLNYYAPYKLLEIKRSFLNRHTNKNKNWNIIDIENELISIRNFIRLVDKNSIPSGSWAKVDEEAYLYFKKEDNKRIWRKANDTRLANTYARYFLFYDFLKKKLIYLYEQGEFSNLPPLQQIYFILSIIKDRTEMGGISFLDLVLHLESINYSCGFTMLKEILQKLEKNEKILLQDEVYTLTFEAEYL